jgi:hypothetical protein
VGVGLGQAFWVGWVWVLFLFFVFWACEGPYVPRGATRFFNKVYITYQNKNRDFVFYYYIGMGISDS